jgi:DNA-nicking Smr family endonuclease
MSKPRHPTIKHRPVHHLSEEDSRLFRETVGPVKPVSWDKVEPEKTLPKPRRRRQQAEWADDIPIHDEPLLATGDVLSFAASGIQKRVLRHLRAGKFDIDAELDLHGLTVDEAKRRLGRFIHLCLADGCRCLHLIHGKGYRSEGDHPILKNRINLWLRQHPDVLAFCSAKSAEGGTGAVYVLLRNKQKNGGDWLDEP